MIAASNRLTAVLLCLDKYLSLIIVDNQFLERLTSSVLELRGDRSQREFAKSLGVSQGAVQSWESKQSVPSLENLVKLAEMRGEMVEAYIAYLFGRSIGESLPVEQRVKTMNLKRIADLNEAIAARLRTLG